MTGEKGGLQPTMDPHDPKSYNCPLSSKSDSVCN